MHSKVKELTEEKTSIQKQIQFERNNRMLEQEQYEYMLKTEQELLRQTRDQVLQISSDARQEAESLNQRLASKNEEITNLTGTVKELNIKLNMARDEII